MAFSVSNTFTDGGTISAADLNENNDDIENIINGGLTNENIASDAAIAISKLAASKQDLIIHIPITNPALLTGTSATAIVSAIVAFPADSGVTWTVTDVKIPVYYGGVGAAKVIDVCYGTPANPAGADRICNAAALAASTGLSSPTITTTSITPDDTKAFYVVMDATSSGVAWDTSSCVGVTIKMTASIRT